MIQPTVGRVVWYRSPEAKPEDQPLAAIVAKVHDDTKVNLAIFSADGTPYSANNIFLWQPDCGRDRPGGGFAEWMPYQLGQAAKTEAAKASAATT